MKEFNLEEAKAGKAVCTRKGLSVRIICFDRKYDYYPIIALVDDGTNHEDICEYTNDGFYYITNLGNDKDLMMVDDET